MKRLTILLMIAGSLLLVERAEAVLRLRAQHDGGANSS